MCVRRTCGSAWRAKTSVDGPRAMLERDLPALGRLDRIGRTQHQHVGHRAQRRQDLHRLVRRAVAADADRVVAEHELHRQPHQRGHAHRRALVVGERQVGDRQRHDAAVRRHAVGHRAHHVLAHAAVHVGAAAVLRREGAQAPLVVGGRLEVGASDHALGHAIDEQVVDLGGDEDAARAAARDRARRACTPAARRASLRAARRRRCVRTRRARPAAARPRVHASARARRGRGGRRRASAASTSAGHLERRRRPAQLLARRGGVFGEQLGAVAAALALQPRDALGDHRAAGDQRRPRVGLGGADRRRHGLEVVAVDFDDVPAGDAKARGDVLADREVGRAVVGDAVVVPQQGQLAQAQVPGQRDHLLADALLQAAVADEGVGAVVDHAAHRSARSGRPRPPPCRRRWRCPGRAGRWSPRCRRRGRTPDGLRSASRSRGRCSPARCRCARSRSGAAAHTAASSRGRWTAPRGRGRARSGRPRRTSGAACTARWRSRPCRAARPGGLRRRARWRRWRESGWRWPAASERVQT